MSYLEKKVCVFACLLLLCVSAWAEENIYIVRKGDTLSEIASKHGVSSSSLARLNDISNPKKLQIGQKLSIPIKPGEPIEYEVQTGDTLERIARKHHTRISTLIELNTLADPDRLKVGQKLVVPFVDSPRSSLRGEHPVLANQLDKIRVTRKWKYIVVHHSATESGTVKGMDSYHRNKRHMEHGLAYHFVIGNGKGIRDGEIAIGDRWRKQLHGGHLRSDSLNEVSIGICLVGNFDRNKPTENQLRSLRLLTGYLLEKADLQPDRVKGHCEINPKPTRCPGRFLSMKKVRAEL
ncbi:MAG: LysM peptidoglycan-binding domain-containing protein [Verrucomicrobia bacterium]|nr:LysM peptidoglycan-binding domain-containing protein [Verrucomicrobiota bacterium]